MSPSRIEDYAMIGDCGSAALIDRGGSIDWLCLPRFDSAACFAALLGKPEHGRWLIEPVEPAGRTERRYLDGSLILVTLFETAGGAVELVDFMPPRQRLSHLVRLVRGLRGRVAMRTEFILRFDYGSVVPWVERLPEGGISAIAGPDRVVLRTPAPLRGEDFKTLGEFSVAAGERVPLVLSYGPSHQPLPPSLEPMRALHDTEAFWRRWSDRCASAGPWTDTVKRSLVVLKGLTDRATGGVVAAPTTSLPEQIGGVRNWDYRYCWLRDAAFTLLALMHAGYYDEARTWRDWLLRAVAGSPDQLQVMYGLGGERRLPEWEVPWLPGFAGSRPVRIGNAAVNQTQLDIYGEILDALYLAQSHGLPPHPHGDAIGRVVLQHLAETWNQPDEGIWEVRGPPQHFTHSKVMLWVAFDRMIKMLEDSGSSGRALPRFRQVRDRIHQDVCAKAFDPEIGSFVQAYGSKALEERGSTGRALPRFRQVRERIHADVCAKGFDPDLGSFVQAYGSKALDASLLLLPLVGFLPPTDPRITGTVEAIERRLVVDGFVRRYDTGEVEDGLPPGEGAFLACSFWLADNWVLQGRVGEARELFERLLALRNDVGLLAEEYDPRQGRQLGNFPQAFSHVALVNTAFNLTRSQGPAEQRAARRIRGPSRRVSRATSPAEQEKPAPAV